MTQRDGMKREMGGGFRMGNTCTPMADSCQCMANSWVGKITWSKKWQPTLVFLPGKFLGQRNLVGYSHRVAKSQT